jgi:glycosyltransferase involved in cell wall biosynthesis
LPEHDLLLVGRGPDRERLERLAEELSLRARVHFAGWRDDVAAVLRASDMLLLPSAWEGMPNVILEAMASGLSIVATDVEGVREVVSPLASEQVVPPHDQEGFAARVRAIAGDGILRKMLGDANRERVGREFTIQSSIKGYEQLYDSLIGE